jgi:hypothetical protein
LEITTDLVLGISSALFGKLEMNVSMKLSSILSCSSGFWGCFCWKLCEQRVAFSKAFKKASFGFEKRLAFEIVLSLSKGMSERRTELVAREVGKVNWIPSK